MSNISIDGSIKMINRSPSISSMSTSENLIANYVEHLCHFNYDKAKSIIEKHREYKDNLKLWTLFQNALIQLVYTEKLYNNIQFLNQRSSTKDKYYEAVVNNLEQIIKDGNTNQSASQPAGASSRGYHQTQQQAQLASSLDISNFLELIAQLLQFTDYRLQMIIIYSNLKEKEVYEKVAHLSNMLTTVCEIEEKFRKIFAHSLLEPLRNLFSLEIELVRNLLECHIALSGSFNCIQSTVNLKLINDLLNKNLPHLNAKQTKESKSFFFNRSSPQQKQIPVLYQWFKLFNQALVNKFSLLMSDSMSMVVPAAKQGEIEHLMNDKIDVYNKIVTYVKKNNVYLCAIILEIENARSFDFKNYSFNGCGYQLKDQATLLSDIHVTDRFPLIFYYPKPLKQHNDKHMNHLIHSISTDLDSKVRYYFDEIQKSSYYVCRIQENWTFCIINELNKQDNKTKTAAFMQEICTELNLYRVFQSFNVNLK